MLLLRSPPHRLLALAGLALALSAWSAWAIASEETRSAAQCRDAPGMLCGFGASIEASFGKTILVPLLAGASICIATAWKALAHPETERSRLATWLGIAHAGPAALAWGAHTWLRATSGACGRAGDVACMLRWHDLSEWFTGAPVALLVMGALALAAWLLPARQTVK